VRGEQLAGPADARGDRRPRAASRYGISVRDALDAIEALGGRNVGEVYEGERRFRLQVRVPSGLRDDIDQVRNLPVSGQSGPLVPLGTDREHPDRGLAGEREPRGVRRRTNVEANVRGRDLASFVGEAQARVRDQVQMPPGYVVQWGGQFENLSAASERLAVAVPVALGLIFILLYMAFGQLKPALLIYLNVPFAAVGGVFLLALRGMPFSISAAIGFIALFGIAVLNGVVLLTTVKKLREQGKSPLEEAREGAESRLRAVVMTATVAALGFIPMALSSSAGAEVQRPLATVVIGGLVSATFLTLFVLTVYFRLRSGRRGGRPAASSRLPGDRHEEAQARPRLVLPNASRGD
jgi:cobalt-zinc-cadmium resistance protein CzcA